QLLRLELLCLFGGVYADPDVVCRRPLDELVAGRTFAAATFADGAVDDSLLLATPGHPAVERLLETFPAAEYWGHPTATVAGLLRAEPDLELLPPSAVAQRGEGGESAFATRLYERVREDDDPKAAALEA